MLFYKASGSNFLRFRKNIYFMNKTKYFLILFCCRKFLTVIQHAQLKHAAN